METLSDLLAKLSLWCEAQPGAVTWCLMQTIDHGRRGFQIFIVEHEEQGQLWNCNANNLEQIATSVRDGLAREFRVAP